MMKPLFACMLLATALFTSACGDDWHYVNTANEPKFENGWHNRDVGRTVRFHRSGDFVAIQGVMSGGGNSAVAFQLPVKYRPTRFLEIGGGSLGEKNNTVNIGVDGKVSAWYESGGENVILNIVYSVK